jgi:hypothetical protein
MKKFSAVVALAVLVAFAAPVLANPFSDVPFSHWAYDAVKKLTEKGIMTGMPDGTFKGEKGVSRYELAVTLARTLDKMGTLRGKVDVTDIKTLEKLTVEFADELALLGVKVTALEDELQTVRDDIAVIKADVGGHGGCGTSCGGLSITGDSWIHIDSLKYEDDDLEDDMNTFYQIGLNFAAKIDEDVSTFFRVVNQDFDNLLIGAEFGEEEIGLAFLIDMAYIDIKGLFDLGDVRIGRQFVKVGNSIALDNKLDALVFCKDIEDLKFALILADTEDANNRQGFDLTGFDLKYAIGEHDAEFYYITQSQEGAGNGDPSNMGLALAGGLVEEVDYILEYGESDDDLGETNSEGDFLLFGVAWDFTDKLGIEVTYAKGDEYYMSVPNFMDANVHYWKRYHGMFGNLGNKNADGMGAAAVGMDGATGSVTGIKDLMVELKSELNEKTDGFLQYETVEGEDTNNDGTVAADYNRLTLGLDHQYAPNTTFGIRYDTVEFDDADTNAGDDGDATDSGGWNRIRIEMKVKF